MSGINRAAQRSVVTLHDVNTLTILSGAAQLYDNIFDASLYDEIIHLIDNIASAAANLQIQLRDSSPADLGSQFVWQPATHGSEIWNHWRKLGANRWKALLYSGTVPSDIAAGAWTFPAVSAMGVNSSGNPRGYRFTNTTGSSVTIGRSVVFGVRY